MHKYEWKDFGNVIFFSIIFAVKKHINCDLEICEFCFLVAMNIKLWFQRLLYRVFFLFLLLLFLNDMMHTMQQTAKFVFGIFTFREMLVISRFKILPIYIAYARIFRPRVLNESCNLDLWCSRKIYFAQESMTEKNGID